MTIGLVLADTYVSPVHELSLYDHKYYIIYTLGVIAKQKVAQPIETEPGHACVKTVLDVGEDP